MSENVNTAPQNQETANAESSQTADVQATAAQAAEQQQQPNATEKPAESAEADKSEPIKYEFKHPEEGAEFNPKVVDKFAEVAGKHQISQEAAQEIMASMSQTLNEVQAEALTALRGQWREQVTADSEIGGDKLNESLATAKKALTQFGGDEMLQLLEETGFGDHPAVIRTFNKIGKAISEDSFVAAGQRASAPVTPAKTMYPNMN